MFPNQSPPQSAVQLHLTTTSGEPDTYKKPKTTTSGGSTEVVRRPRGRPPGIKNKQKSSVSVTKKPHPNMSHYVLEVSGGSDIIAAVMQFCNSRKISLCLLSGSGSVSNVSLQLPTTTAVLTVRGRFNLLSISATIIPSFSPVSAMLPPSTTDCLAKFVISLAGPRGQMFGGVVVGPLIASGTVYIIGATFSNPLYHRLPMEDNDDHIRSSGYGSVPAAVDQSPGSSVGGDNGQHHAAPQPPPTTVVESLSMYGFHQFPPGFRWTPTQLQAPPRFFTSLLNGSS